MLIDTHCHLDDPSYAGDAAGVVARAHEAGVMTMVTVGTDPEGSRRALRLADQFETVWAVVGIHPNEAGAMTEEGWAVLRELARHHKVRGVGETGLDFYREHAPHPLQELVFRRSIALAREAHLPLVIHTREASQDTVKILREEGAEALGGVFHCFSGDPALLEAGKALGFYFSVGGVATYPKADNVREAIRLVPDDRLMMETDAPYLAPKSRRGKTNEPAFMVESAQQVAEVKGWTLERLAQMTTENAMRFFKLKI